MEMKERLDAYLVRAGLFGTRTKAQAAILAGEVLVNENPAAKAGQPIKESDMVRVRESSPWVGRGAFKLLAALDAFSIPCEGRTGIDVGASTGGFTQVLLSRGAVKVYAVDVGTNQLDWKLRSDPRVVCMENTHAKDLVPAMFHPAPDLCAMDVSFISVTKILPAVIPCLARPFDLVVLIKPQFELSPGLVGNGGLVAERDRPEAIARVLAAANSLGLAAAGEVIPSPIAGAKSGNVEYLAHFRGGVS
jgi:23S rRNA (cytidine1920-2'-O)/16S rRNA (cytidine1409-2'-O)-methyltransferase